MRRRLNDLISLAWRGDVNIAAVAGVVTATCIGVLNYVFPVGGPDPPLLPLFTWLFVTMVVCGAVIAMWGHWLAILFFAAGGLFVGVMATSLYDGVINHIDRNLFPFEIAIDGVLLLPGMAIGVALARAVRWFAARRARNSVGSFR